MKFRVVRHAIYAAGLIACIGAESCVAEGEDVDDVADGTEDALGIKAGNYRSLIHYSGDHLALSNAKAPTLSRGSLTASAKWLFDAGSLRNQNGKCLARVGSAVQVAACRPKGYQSALAQAWRYHPVYVKNTEVQYGLIVSNQTSPADGLRGAKCLADGGSRPTLVDCSSSATNQFWYMAGGQANVKSQFGVTGAMCGDAALAPGSFVKTWSDYRSDNLKSWRTSHTKCGLIQTPLIVNNWGKDSDDDGIVDTKDPCPNNDDTSCTSSRRIDYTYVPPFPAAAPTLEAFLKKNIAENPQIPTWELGLEENVHNKSTDGCCTPKQVNLLDAKFRAAQRARGRANVDFAYQMVNVFTRNDIQNNCELPANNADPLDRSTCGSYRALFNSNAIDKIDVVALHPYTWGNWPTPERWHDEYLAAVRSLYAKSGNKKRLRLMYSEIGAPVCDDAEAGCIVNAQNKRSERGQGPMENAQYLIKLHTLAYAGGVERVYWYHNNKPDGTPDPICHRAKPNDNTSSEECFGLVNVEGPRPSYFAYQAMTSCATGRNPKPTKIKVAGKPDVQAYEFKGAADSCIVAWTYKTGVTEATVPKHPITPVTFQAISHGRAIERVLDTTGRPINQAQSLRLTPSPIFIYAKK